MPSAATWSRSRHSGIPGQGPLRSRLAPLGLPSLTPLETDKVNSANRALEVLLWCAEQALCCKTKAVGLNIIFPEDLGGQQSEGPSSLWVLREIQLLEGIHDARRAAGYPCQFTRTDYKRPLGVFSTSRKLRTRLSLGWPRLDRIHDRLVYKGPLPENCACNHIHTPMIGISADDVVCSSGTHTFSVDFWNILFLITLWSRSSAPSGTRVCRLTSLRCIQLVCLRCSHLPLLLVWARFVTCTKHGRLETCTRTTPRDISVQSLAILISLRRLRNSLVTSPRSQLASLWKVTLVSPSAPFRMCLLVCRLPLLPQLLLPGYGTRDQGLQQV